MFSTSLARAQLVSLSVSSVNFSRGAAPFQSIDEGLMMAWVTIPHRSLGKSARVTLWQDLGLLNAI